MHMHTRTHAHMQYIYIHTHAHAHAHTHTCTHANRYIEPRVGQRKKRECVLILENVFSYNAHTHTCRQVHRASGWSAGKAMCAANSTC